MFIMEHWYFIYYILHAIYFYYILGLIDTLSFNSITKLIVILFNIISNNACVPNKKNFYNVAADYVSSPCRLISFTFIIYNSFSFIYFFL